MASERLASTARGPVGFPADTPLGERWGEVVARHGDRVAVDVGGRRVTYRELDVLVSVVESRVRALVAVDADGDGTGPGSTPEAGGGRRERASEGRIPVVGILGMAGPELVAVQVGTMLAGGAWISVDPARDEFQREGVLSGLGLSAVVDVGGSEVGQAGGMGGVGWIRRLGVPVVAWETWKSPIPRVARVAAGVGANARGRGAGGIFLTSGSTGLPKRVWYPVDGLVRDIARQTGTLHLSAGDRVDLLFAPSFSASLASMYDALLNGGTLCVRDLRVAGVAGLGRWLREEGITVSTMSVSTLRALLVSEGGGEGGSGWPSLRLVSTGGEPLFAEDVRRFREVFGGAVVLQNAYASTEMRTVAEWLIHESTPVEPGPVCVGWEVEGREVWLEDEAGRGLEGVGEMGQLVVRGIGGVPWRAGADAGGLDGTDGRMSTSLQTLCTGDVGWRDVWGRLHLVGRLDDLVKVRGQRVALAEVEAAVLERHPGWKVKAELVVDRLVVAVEVGDLGGGASGGLALEGLPGRLRPHRVLALDRFPSTHTGKVDRVRLREVLSVRMAGDGGAAVDEEEWVGEDGGGDGVGMEERVRRLLAEVLGRPGWGVDGDLVREGGIDSLQWAVVRARLEGWSGRLFAPGELAGCRTVRALASHLGSGGTEDGIGVEVLSVGSPGGPHLVYFSAHAGRPAVVERLVGRLGLGWGVRVVHFAATGLSPGRRRRLVELAAACVERLVRELPAGGFLGLGGFCLGGLVAHEVAALLERRGLGWREVGVVLIETHTYARRKGRVRRLCEDLGRLEWRHVRRLVRPEERATMIQRVRQRHGVAGDAREAGETGDWETDPSLAVLMEGYVPATRLGGVCLVFGSVRRREIERRSAFHLEAGWERYVRGGVDRVEVEGADHWTLMEAHGEAVVEAAVSWMVGRAGRVGS